MTPYPLAAASSPAHVWPALRGPRLAGWPRLPLSHTQTPTKAQTDRQTDRRRATYRHAHELIRLVPSELLCSLLDDSLPACLALARGDSLASHLGSCKRRAAGLVRHAAPPVLQNPRAKGPSDHPVRARMPPPPLPLRTAAAQGCCWQREAADPRVAGRQRQGAARCSTARVAWVRDGR